MMEHDPDTVLAYYCWVNRGWAPSQYDALSPREKILVAVFAQEEASERKSINESLKK